MLTERLEKLNIYIFNKLVSKKWFQFVFLNPILKAIKNIIYYIFNLFFLPYFYSSCTAQLRKLSSDTQIFLVTRHDFGNFILTLHYLSCWQKQRSKTCLIILTSKFSLVKDLAKMISPETTIIFPNTLLCNLAVTLFGINHVHYQTIMPVYARLSIDNPNLLYIFGQTSIGKKENHASNYVSFFDSSLPSGKKLFSSQFCQAYGVTRKIIDNYLDVYLDSMKLHYSSDLSKPLISFPEKLDTLKSQLGIKSNYVVFNINLKKYYSGNSDKKRVQYPERYNCLIDALIEKGYTIVIQGRGEQPFFRPRKGLIDYPRTPYASIENDVVLYSGCEFAIISKSGPDNFTLACNVPLLGLNYVELTSVQANLKMRYYPKHVRDNKTGSILSWHEVLKSPCYFDIGANSYQDVEYLDLEEEEMMEALEEFLPLISLPPDGWLNYTDHQKNFKESLHPMHLDAYYIKSVPCECYLKKQGDTHVDRSPPNEREKKQRDGNQRIHDHPVSV
jgi:putative glycosyltransferase (TIGR04372 family)